MERDDELRDFMITGQVYKGTNKIIFNAKPQKIHFKYDRFTRGKRIAVSLTDGPIDEPDIEIYFDHNEIKNLLKFLTFKEHSTKKSKK